LAPELEGMTKSKTGLMRWVIGDRQFMEVPKSTINLLQAAMDDLGEIVDIEQKFEILYSNFIELEEEIAVCTLQETYRHAASVTELFDYTLAMTRRVGNLLSSGRLYVDQVKHHISALFPKDAATKAEVDGYFSHEYDRLLGYRVMEALRNYSQHRGLPVHGMTHAASWVDDDLPTKRVEHNAALNIFMKELKSDDSIKARVMAELAELGETVDLKPLIREYVEGLANAHLKIRALLEPRRKQAEDVVLEWRERFRQHAKLDKTPVGLVAGRALEDRTAEKFFALTDNPIVYAAALRARTSVIGNLSKRAVSTRKIVKKEGRLGTRK
jgi:hypothetical protein